MLIGLTAIAVTCVTLYLLTRARLVGAGFWRATATPLASIIGSGFLVSVPILRDVAGSWAVMAMAGLLLLALAIGGAIRHNIMRVEPLLNNGNAPTTISSIERLSHIVLAFAYFVSIAYYLVLFAAFLLKLFGNTDILAIKLIVTFCLAVIGGVGLWRGFRAVEGLEIYIVSLKLAVIAGLLAALVIYNADLLLATGATSQAASGHVSRGGISVLLGLLILVQGFETSRFLGADYAPSTRARSMLAAQLIASAIYIAFFTLMIAIQDNHSADEGVAAIVDMLAPVSFLLPFLVIAGALASQSSAAIADTLGAGGLLHSILGGRIMVRHTYPLIAFVAGIIVWETDIYALIALASRSFALYYALQSGIAALSAYRQNQLLGAGWYAILTAVCGTITAFGTPAEGG